MGRKDKPDEGPPAPFNSALAGLAKLRDAAPPGPAPAPVAAPPGPRGPARAVVRLERKGRGGKEVTVVEKLELGTRELERWLTDLKSQLGCGGRVEDNALVLQGDQRERVKSLLTARGVKKVIG